MTLPTITAVSLLLGTMALLTVKSDPISSSSANAIGKQGHSTQHAIVQRFIPPSMWRSKQNCSNQNDVFIEHTGKCRRQAPLGASCRYNIQCSYLTPNAICTWASDDSDVKTCQCRSRDIPSARSTSCVPKQPCTPSPALVLYAFNPVDPDRGSCRPNMQCLKKERYCICSRGFEMDDRGDCVITHFDDNQSVEDGGGGQVDVAQLTRPVHPPVSLPDQVCEVRLIQLADALNRQFEADTQLLRENLKNECDSSLKIHIVIMLALIFVILSGILFGWKFIFPKLSKGKICSVEEARNEVEMRQMLS